MNRQLTTILTLGILASMAIGSTGHKVNADGNVAVEFNNTINPLAENISSIELIPLETDSEHLVGGVTDLTIAGDSYIVMDLINNNIFRYSADGKFLGRIGQKGNGPEEYIRINDILYRDGNLCVFSTPSKLQRFSLDGNMIDSKIFPEMDLGSMSWLTDEGVLTYYGYGAGFLLWPAERR
ncbi:MAG: 6-bladed beta-propeller [Alistipes sp.]|nr:6-bladed beta-propeller [Alistipes sp.]